MRYRIGTELPPPGTPSTDHALYLEAGLGLIVGIILVLVGRYGRQRWLLVWGATLVLASGTYISALLLGWGTA